MLIAKPRMDICFFDLASLPSLTSAKQNTFKNEGDIIPFETLETIYINDY